MALTLKNGQTSNILRLFLQDSSSSTGAGLTGLTSGSSGLIISTIANNELTAVAYTVAGSTIEAVTTIGSYSAPTATKCRFKVVDATNHPGVYEIQIADARFAVSSARSLLITVSGATNLAQTNYEVQLVGYDPTTDPAAVALATTTYAEPGQGDPSATTTLAAKINYLYKQWRNKYYETATDGMLYDDAGTTVDQKFAISTDATSVTRGEVATGP